MVGESHNVGILSAINLQISSQGDEQEEELKNGNTVNTIIARVKSELDIDRFIGSPRLE